MGHGIKVNEITTAIEIPSVSSGAILVVGTARNVNKSGVLAYNFSEYEQEFGYIGDFKKYTLDEAAKTIFNLYNISPAIFINVLDEEKHSKIVERELEGVTQFEVSGEVVSGSIEVTSGEKVPVEVFEANADYEVRSDEVEDLDEGTTNEVITLHILNGDKVVDNKIKISYRTLSTALGGTAIETEVKLHGLIYELPSDTVIESVEVESGGADNLVELETEIVESSGVTQLKIKNTSAIVDNKVKVRYRELDTALVSAADIIGNENAGKSTGLQMAESLIGKFGVTITTIIAPGYSENGEVAAAMSALAKKINAVGISDVAGGNYISALANKKLSSTHLVSCYPRVSLNGEEYHLSTHLAGLMSRVDADNDDLPYVSPSNKTLQIDAVSYEGEEVYLTQEQCEMLNNAGIVTVFGGYGSLRAWGNYTSIGSSDDYKDRWISVRRMINHIKNYLSRTYISKLDVPVTRRQIDSLLQSSNLYLSGLVTAQALIGGRLEFLESENSTTDLMSGRLSFHLYLLPPPPAQEISFNLEIDTAYFSELFE